MIFKERFKKFAAPLLAGAVILAGAAGYAGTHAFAASTQAQSAAGQESKDQNPDYKASITPGQQDNGVDENKDNGNEAKEDAALALKAKISKDEAVISAKTAYPEYVVKNADLGDENGNLIYEVKMEDKAGVTLEVKVDAGNAKVLAADKDTGEKEDKIGNEKSGAQDKESGSENEKSGSGIDNDNVEVEE